MGGIDYPQAVISPQCCGWFRPCYPWSLGSSRDFCWSLWGSYVWDPSWCSGIVAIFNQSHTISYFFFCCMGWNHRPESSQPAHRDTPPAQGTRVCCAGDSCRSWTSVFPECGAMGPCFLFRGSGGALFVAHCMSRIINPRLVPTETARNCYKMWRFEIVICHFAWQAWDFVALRREICTRFSNRLARCASSECCKTWRFDVAKLHFVWHAWGFVALRRVVLRGSPIDWLAVSSRFATRVWSMECEVWSAEREIWCVEWRVWSVEWRVWSVEWRLLNVGWRLWSVGCGLWSGECGVLSVEWRVWSVECGVWSVVESVECGVKSVECGVWSGEWRVWSVECGV